MAAMAARPLRTLVARVLLRCDAHGTLVRVHSRAYSQVTQCWAFIIMPACCYHHIRCSSVLVNVTRGFLPCKMLCLYVRVCIMLVL